MEPVARTRTRRPRPRVPPGLNPAPAGPVECSIRRPHGRLVLRSAQGPCFCRPPAPLIGRPIPVAATAPSTASHGGGRRQPSTHDAGSGRAAPTARTWRWCKGHPAAVSLREASIRFVNACRSQGRAITDDRSVKRGYPAPINGLRDVEKRVTSILRCNAWARAPNAWAADDRGQGPPSTRGPGSSAVGAGSGRRLGPVRSGAEPPPTSDRTDPLSIPVHSLGASGLLSMPCEGVLRPAAGPRRDAGDRGWASPDRHIETGPWVCSNGR